MIPYYYLAKSNPKSRRRQKKSATTRAIADEVRRCRELIEEDRRKRTM